ncbi:putative LPS assembly protein LptD [Pontimicrobium sp. SW4]|uniref:LPS assembly protein LptD n=1 Tax=Pontimicrobium sp. SW4 TaxID=3153519 RepID=A0AAU7BXD3_9FLAO
MAIQKPSHTFTKIHLKALRTNIFQILFALSFTVLINTFSYAQDIPPKKEKIKPIVARDTIPIKIDSLKTRNAESNILVNDTIKLDSIPNKPKLLKDIVKYSASGYTSITRKDQKITLYDNAQINYEDMEITAGIIVIDYEKNEVYAGRLKDSLGNYTQAPIFKQGSDVVEPDSIRFNFDTQKALIFNSRTEQSGGYIIAETTKKENDSVYFIDRGKFTTSKDLENPEYYFLMRKAKIVPGKKVVTGLTNMFIADVPTPIGLPFAYFPLTQKRTSGVIFPSFGEQNSRGYFVQNGGYYFAVSDYFDLALLGDYYTNGSYGMRIESNYAVRYKFRGNLSFRYENLISSERGFPDYSKSAIYNLRWSHSQDGKANPSSRFSASVNLGSSRYYQQSINQLNASNYLNNTLSSSVSYSKTFQGEPQVNVSLTANHSQNTNTQTINMTLPTFQGSIGRVFPFAPRIGAKKGIIQNINLQYNTRAENRIQTTDSLFFKKEMFEDAKVGMQHSIPISTNFKVFNYLSLSASANFQETWTLNTIEKSFNQATQKTVITEKNGFDSFRTYNFSASIGTTLYGMFEFGEDKKIQAIRHVMRPSISYNISPAFDQYYDTYEVISADGLTSTEADYTRFEQSIFGSPTNNYSSAIGISVSNNFEAKIRDRDSTVVEPKKITLINNLNFSTSYNLAGDSLKWSPVRVNGGFKLLKDMTVNFGATLDPYALDSNNIKIDEFNINNGGSLFRLTSANLTTGYSFSSNDSEKDDNTSNSRSQQESLRSGGRDDDLFGKPQDFADKSFNNNEDDSEAQKPSDLYRYKIPWNIRLAYAINYSNTRRQNEIASHSLMFSGDIEISPRWTLGASSGYDLKNKGITYTQLRFERDLESWRMNFSWIPFSANKQWNFFIGIKSSILQDIKYEKRRQRDRDL